MSTQTLRDVGWDCCGEEKVAGQGSGVSPFWPRTPRSLRILNPKPRFSTSGSLEKLKTVMLVGVEVPVGGCPV